MQTSNGIEMRSSRRFEGVYANLPTPLTDDGNALDLDRLHALIDFLLAERIDGIACLLSSGEYPYLSHSERLELAAEVVRYVSGRVPVIVGVSALTTAEAIAFAVHAEAIGAAAAMVMPMQYWLLRRDEVVDFFCRACGVHPFRRRCMPHWSRKPGYR
jgi:4-hydroxy-tetrahydrodipicolinate synthase